MSHNVYKGVIWTNHALERLDHRGLSQEMAYKALTSADTVQRGKKEKTTEFSKKFQSSLVTVIATQNEKKEWVVLSCWINPPLPGSAESQYKKKEHAYRRASGWVKVLLLIKKQLGF